MQETREGRVGTYSLVCQDKKTKKLRQIYVHSKLLIVDDKWITIGSANTDKNGFKDSTEVNIGITSSQLSKELRTRLWCEHLGLLEKTKNSTNKHQANRLQKMGQNGENWSLHRMLTTQILRTLIADSTSGRR